jgi:hypothetical protein
VIVDALLSEGEHEVAVCLELVDELNEGSDNFLKFHVGSVDPTPCASGPIPFSGTGLRPVRCLLNELCNPLLNVLCARSFFPATDALSSVEC